MRRHKITPIILYAFFSLSPVLNAQDAAAILESENEPKSTAASGTASGGSFFETVVRLNEFGDLSEEASDAADRYIIQRIEYENAMLANTEEVIRRNNETTDVVFWVAHCAIVIGMVAALIEFFHSFRLRARGVRTDNADVTLALESIAIKNASIGTVLLLVSIAIYGLFLKFVFPIQELGG